MPVDVLFHQLLMSMPLRQPVDFRLIPTGKYLSTLVLDSLHHFVLTVPVQSAVSQFEEI